MPRQNTTTRPESTTPAQPSPLSPDDSVIAVAVEAWDQAEAQHWIPITGRSMMPLLREGDVVLVIHSKDNTRLGDVVVFCQKGRLVAHRVLRIARDGAEDILVTKGDSVRRFDAPVSAKDILGRVVSIQRGERRIRLDTPGWRAIGWLVVVVTLAVAMPYRWVRALKGRWCPRNRRNHQQREDNLTL
jgi:signal peptidase